jgi:hypothetical protein
MILQDQTAHRCRKGSINKKGLVERARKGGEKGGNFSVIYINKEISLLRDASRNQG